MTAEQNQVRPGSWSIPGQWAWPYFSACPCTRADPGPPKGCAGACSLGQLFPLFTPSRKEELVNKEKIQGIV